MVFGSSVQCAVKALRAKSACSRLRRCETLGLFPLVLGLPLV